MSRSEIRAERARTRARYRTSEPAPGKTGSRAYTIDTVGRSAQCFESGELDEAAI
jgi:hypothetical protein